MDIRADIYGLGCTLYKLLSGRAPFGGPEHPDAPDKLAAHRRAPVPPIRQLRPEIPAGLAAVLDCMLAKDREARYSTPADVAEALGPWSTGADLTGLLQRAAEAEEDAGAERISCARSAPAVQAADKWRPPSAFRRWKSPAKLVGLMFLVGAIGLVLGITIRFRKDGQETTIDVPLGSTTRIGADGHVDVSLSERRNAVSAVAVPDRTAIPDAGRAAERGEGSANILSNSGAEKGGEDPDGWEQGAAIEGVRYSWDKQVAFDGKASLSIEKTANRYFPIAQWFQTVNRKGELPALEVSAQVRARKMTKAILDVVFYDKDGQWISHKWAAYIGSKREGEPPADHDWRRYLGKVNIPDGTAELCIGLQVYGPGKIWFDCIEARYVK